MVAIPLRDDLRVVDKESAVIEVAPTSIAAGIEPASSTKRNP